MKKLIFFLAFNCLAVVIYGQQDAQYTQFMFNKLAINPAYAGSKHVFCASALYRNQWVGMDGAPITQAFNMHGRFDKKNIGLGISVVHDEIGIFNDWYLNMMYDYQLKLGKGKLNIGAQGSVNYMKARWDLSQPDQIGDYTIGGANSTKLYPNFGAGVYYHTPTYFIGVSAPNLIKHDLEFTSPQAGDEISNKDRHYFLMAGMVLKLNHTVQFQPSILFKHVNHSPFDFDVNASFLFFNKLLAGVSYRFQDSVDGILQFHFNPCLKVGFAYDYTLSELRKYHSGSFEVMIEYCIIPKEEAFVNPRFF